MKLKKIMFKEHDILGDLVIDFNDANGKVLNTVAFIGENGSGKSVILKELANQIDNIVQNKENDKIILEMYEGETLNNGANLVYFPDRVEYDERLCSKEEWVRMSSGERQLLYRIEKLKLLNLKNSIIIIDEPEISLHPKMQRNLVKRYENIGENNQIIMATHSPHIIGNVKKEQLRVLKRDEDVIKLVDSNEVEESYGKTVESILMEIMGIRNTRNEETAEKIEKLRDLVREDKYDSEEFDELYEILRVYLGNLDIDLNLIDMEVKRSMNKRK